MADLLKENTPFIHYWANRYVNVSDVDYDDLVQEGLIGLQEAIEKYNPDRGKFIDYAFPWIKGRMLDAIEATSLIKLPENVYKRSQRLRKAKITLTQKLERNPTMQDVANYLGMDLQKVLDLDDLPTTITSMDTMISEESPLSYFISEEEEKDTGFMDVLNFRLDEMPVRLRVVINMRYGLNGRPQRSLKECGKILGVSYEWVRHLENEALKYLKVLKDA